ncbi:N-acetyl-gamma-glutamyl-phosphate reductase [Catenuloplanes atrovinosus]|uniref:N-acetyl-gamma-glutamyl-phosphate reductase n=1 Tax=Catenuloplanes atrovinosus TaxID=137266 RepID=A0AAE3YKF9_9ACTN|nr:N-acetyl-gamma-glutamyl-phosphate reductase [Catenuloplanes atrovinosus]MDR7275434.1 N-acetyl-gamma-glutamyl-phosphate reductase [Catenuloplanes atrovinosus]
MAEQEKVRVAVLGASGYTGAELVRLLLDHPHVELSYLSSERHSGRPVSSVLAGVRNHPRAAGLRFRPLEACDEVDVAFGCLPGGALPAQLPKLTERAGRIINLAGDFRLRDAAQAAVHYPESASWTEPFRYFVPEFSASPVPERLLNLPGCMAVTTLYALQPLFAAGLATEDVVVDAKTGASGGGSRSAEHPADRIGNFRVHKPYGHRHAPEITQALGDFAGTAPRLRFSTYSLDVARGIVVTAYGRLRPGVSAQDVKRAYGTAYARTPFVRFRGAARTPADFPMLKSVVGSNVAEVAVSVEGDQYVAVAALDNLIKGASGQAVQALNTVYGFAPSLALPFTAVTP